MHKENMHIGQLYINVYNLAFCAYITQLDLNLYAFKNLTKINKKAGADVMPASAKTLFRVVYNF